MWTGSVVQHVVAALVMASPAPVAPIAVAPPARGQVTIEKLAVNGTGCRAATVAVAMSQDNTAFTVIYSAYQVMAGGASKPADGRKGCSITVRLNVPATLTFAVSQVDYRGFAILNAGASASQSARYHFQGQGKPEYTLHNFPAGLDDAWQLTDAVPTAAALYGPCGKDRKLDIDTELSVRAPTGAPVSLLGMDSTDAAVTSIYRLSWKDC